VTDQPTETLEAPEQPPVEAPVTVTDGETSPEVFPADTVRELRDELAKRRVRSREQTAAANARLATAYAAADGRLVEPDLIEITDDLLGDDGLIDAAKMSAAIDALIEAKPYLASRKPTEPIVQGVQPQTPEAAGLFSLIRDRF
jgi:hypothetical protein